MFTNIKSVTTFPVPLEPRGEACPARAARPETWQPVDTVPWGPAELQHDHRGAQGRLWEPKGQGREERQGNRVTDEKTAANFCKNHLLLKI